MENISEAYKKLSKEELSKLPGFIPAKKCPACKEWMSFEILKGYICINEKCKSVCGHTFRSKNAVLGAVKLAVDYQKNK